MLKINLNTSYIFFDNIKNIDVTHNDQSKPQLKDAISITDSNNDLYIIYKDINNNIGVHYMNNNYKNSELDNIIFLLSLLISNKEKLKFKDIKNIFMTYINKYNLKDCEINDLKRLIDNNKY